MTSLYRFPLTLPLPLTLQRQLGGSPLAQLFVPVSCPTSSCSNHQLQLLPPGKQEALIFPESNPPSPPCVPPPNSFTDSYSSCPQEAPS